jgi:4-amino-4-deoxy-L-arabinose transferase-like glycosyltransferase
LQRARGDYLLLGFVFLACSGSTIAWTALDETPPPWDPSDHLRWAWDYYANLAQGNVGGFFEDLLVNAHPYPPLVHLGTAGVFLVGGAGRVTGIAINLVLLAVLLVSVRTIGNTLYAGRCVRAGPASFSAGAVAAVLTASYHFPAWLMHDAFLDFPLTVIVAAGFAALVRCQDFSSLSRAAVFGGVAGLGMLTKQTFAFFFLLPGLYVAICALRSGNREKLRNLMVAAVIGLAVAAVWYLPHLDDVLEIYRINRMNAQVENEPGVFSVGSLFFYPYALLAMQMQAPLAAAFVVGAAWSPFGSRRQSVILYLWLASGLLAFTFIANKDVRYTVPVLPAAALLSVSWMGDGPGRRLGQSAAVGALLALAAAGFANAQWPGSWSPLPNHYFGFDHRPLPHDWGVRRAVEAIAADRTAERPHTGVVVNLPHLNPSSVAAYARLLAPAGGYQPLMDVDWLTSDAALERIAECEYLIVRTDVEDARDVSVLERRAAAWLQANPEAFEPLAAFELPSGYGEAVVLKAR